MKKAESELTDWSRPEYKRSDLSEIVRGKDASRIRNSTNVIVLDPQVAKVFPNDKTVNDALRGLIKLARRFVKHLPTTNNDCESVCREALTVCQHAGNRLQQRFAAEGFGNVRAEACLQRLVTIQFRVGRDGYAGYRAGSFVRF